MIQDTRIINDLSEEQLEHFGRHVILARGIVDRYDAKPPHSQPLVTTVPVEGLRALVTIIYILTNTARTTAQATVELHGELEMRGTKDAPSVTVSDIINAHKKKDDGH